MPKKIQELFWIVLSAYRPQPSTHATGKDDTIILIADFHVISRIDLKSRHESTKIFAKKQEKARKIHLFIKNLYFVACISFFLCNFAPGFARIGPDGGIGRRAGLKHQWGNPSRFEPGSGY